LPLPRGTARSEEEPLRRSSLERSVERSGERSGDRSGARGARAEPWELPLPDDPDEDPDEPDDDPEDDDPAELPEDDPPEDPPPRGVADPVDGAPPDGREPAWPALPLVSWSAHAGVNVSANAAVATLTVNFWRVMTNSCGRLRI